MRGMVVKAYQIRLVGGRLMRTTMVPSSSRMMAERTTLNVHGSLRVIEAVIVMQHAPIRVGQLRARGFDDAEQTHGR